MSAGSTPRRGPNWKAIAGIAISLFFLYLALRDVDAAQVVREIRRADPFWLFLTAVMATATIAVRAWRWNPLLRPVLPRSSFRSRLAATFIRFGVNNVVPARVGEFAGAYSLSRMERISVSASFGSLVVERVLDALLVVLLLFTSMSLPGFPAERLAGSAIVAGARTVLIGVLLLAIALLVAVIWPHPAVRFVDRIAASVLPHRLRRKVVDALHAFLEGVSSLRRPALLFQAVAGSFAVWGVSALSFYFALRAFDIDVPPLAASLFLQTSIALAVAIPSAPGFFGLFEGAARLGLVGLWQVDVNKAVGFAIGMHLVGFVPVTVIGLYYLWTLGLSLREVEASEEIVEAGIEAEALADGADGDSTAP